MKLADYKPLFPYFGGKSRIARAVWAGLGDVPNYVEPFFGSGAVLLLRPHEPGIETVNDADGLLCNFWRALQADPEQVAAYADWPVSECDLHARHSWLVGQREQITDRLQGDHAFYDAKSAGWWVWGISCWIGGGWCSGNGPWISVDGVFVNGAAGGVRRKLPHLGDAGMGVNRQRPHLGNAGMGVNRQLPHLGSAGMGVNRKLPHLGNAGRGALLDYLAGFAERLRRVRVCCGDWSRVCGPTPTTKRGLTGVFLDPPYADTADRCDDVYAVDCSRVAHDVREWAIERGEEKDMRIVLAGYDGEHIMPDNWRVQEWKTSGGYGSRGDDEDEAGRRNSRRERLWFSPHCLKPDDSVTLFELAAQESAASFHG